MTFFKETRYRWGKVGRMVMGTELLVVLSIVAWGVTQRLWLLIPAILIVYFQWRRTGYYLHRAIWEANEDANARIEELENSVLAVLVEIESRVS